MYLFIDIYYHSPPLLGVFIVETCPWEKDISPICPPLEDTGEMSLTHGHVYKWNTPSRGGEWEYMSINIEYYNIYIDTTLWMGV